MARAGAALTKARQDVENARDARKPGDAAEDAADGGMPANALVAALKRKPPKAQPRKALLSGPISGLGRTITGASTSSTRVGY
jgi:hypothetical protein